MTTVIEQRRVALGRANETRLARAALKRRLFAGELTFAEALDDPAATGMVVWALLQAKRGVGPTWCTEVAIELSRRRVIIGWGARVRALTDRQRIALVEIVERKAAKGPLPPRRRSPRAKRAPRPELVAAAAEAQAQVESPPLRCTRCKAQLLVPSPSGMCGFCEAEAEEAA